MKILKISKRYDSPRYQVIFQLPNSKIAKDYEISLLMSVRNQWGALMLIAKADCLILDGPIDNPNGIRIPEQEMAVNSVAEMIKNKIENDVPGFKTKIETIISMYKEVEGLDLDMAPAIDQALKERTKIRFMAANNFWIYAKIIKKAMEGGPYNSYEEFDRTVNLIFDDKTLISSFIKEIDDWKKGNMQ